MHAALVREVRFVASHHYRLHGGTEAESRAVFGDQALPHRHQWRVRIVVAGEIDRDTGFVADLSVLDSRLAQLVGDWREGDLNERIPEVRGGSMQPSTESLARWIYERLSPVIPNPAKLERVYVWESEDLGAYYPV